MPRKDELTRKKEQTASRIITYARDRLISFMPYFNRAILKMPLELFETKSQFEVDDLEETPTAENCGTDGIRIYVDPDFILKSFKKNPAKVPRIYMHMVFHCLFYHPFQYDKMEFDIWDFASDVAVENTIIDMKWRDLELPEDVPRRRFIEKLKQRVETVTAENIYNYYMDNRLEWARDSAQAYLFREDDHALWVSVFHIVGKQRYSNRSDLNGRGNNVLEEWKELGKSIRLDVESHARYREEKAGSVIDNIKEVFKEKHDYRDFLRKFVSRDEEIKIDHDEFDYIYYTYGMTLYGNIPLIEPLEYREENKIHDFVIAIDTSGSCRGEVVRSFLNKTHTILMESGCFFESMNVCIIQCDSKIQSTVRIRSREDFERYITDIEILGYGGTDFRPVFEHVDKMVRNREFSDLQGLIYLTDGLGVYPKAVPKYKTAFMIIEDPKEKADVPDWAIKLFVKKNEVLQDGRRLLYTSM